MFEKCSKAIFPVTLANFGTIYTTKKPFIVTIKCLNGSNSPNSLQKIVLLEKLYISNFHDVKMFEKCSKVIFPVILANFGLYNNSKALYSNNKGH